MTTTHHMLTTSLRTSANLEVALDPVWDTQSIFRDTLNAFAWPGSIRQLSAAATGAPINPWAAALLVTLLDHEAKFGVDPFDSGEGLEHFIQQRTNALSSTPAEADFVLARSESIDPELLLRLKRGSLAYPDDGASLVLLVDSLNEDATAGLRLELVGPGVPDGHYLDVSRLSVEIIEARNEAVAGYPCGIDLILVDADGLLAVLPRSTEITISTEEGP